MKKSELVNQSIDFSICLVGFYKWLVYEKKEYVISKQILRSGTSIGANIHEAKYAVSRMDFINKMHIALKEASETEYWLVVLNGTGYESKQTMDLKLRCEGLKKMLVKSINTSKKTK